MFGCRVFIGTMGVDMRGSRATMCSLPVHMVAGSLDIGRTAAADMCGSKATGGKR